MALAVCSAAPLAAQTLTTWSDPVKVTASDGALTKSSGCDGCADSGAHSGTHLTGDGSAEFVAPALTRLFAGLGADLSATTASSTINYAFSLWPSGAWEVRELGTYRKEGTYAAGDRFRVAVESGVVVYRHNGGVVYTSKVPPVYPLGLDVTLYAVGASLSQATLDASAVVGVTYDPPPTLTSVGPYRAVVDRTAYAKPVLPVLGPAGSKITDPIFSTPIRRITDNATRPGTLNRSYRTPSSPHQNAWSAKASYFYIMGSGGVGPIPYAFDAATGTARRLAPSSTGDGGLVLKFYIEPQFSYVNDSLIYGSYSGTGSTLHTIDQYDLSSGAYTRLFDLEALVGGLSGTYIGGISSSGSSTERIEAFFGGTSQDHHHYVVVFDRANPQNRQILDTWASTINGAPSPITLNFSLHHAMIDRSGRYVMLYSTTVDQASPRYAAQEYLWDTATGSVTELGTAALPYGHDAFGYGVYVNKDCCTTSTWDAGQWQFRSLASPFATRDLIKTVQTPKEIYLSDHTTWNNARADRLTPVISGLYRFGNNTAAWRAWDDEIVGLQTDAPAGTESTVWRFAHHRTDVSYDGDPTRVAFWYQPHANVSQDGKWILFTSNWEKTLGIDPVGEAGTGARQDVFLLSLTPATIPVAIGSTTLPAGRATIAYSAAMSATGGSGAYVWSTGTSLPAGLMIDAASGQISGTPLAAISSAVAITVADAANTSNTATVTLPLAIGAAPVAVTTATVPSVRATVAYSTTLTASGGSGAFTWSLASGSLPAGMTLNASTGILGGTATTAGQSDFTLTVADTAEPGNNANRSFTLDVTASPVAIGTASLPSVRATVGYAASLTASGGTGTYSWSIASGSLPNGVVLDAATGALSGVPTSAGTSTFTVCATDGGDGSNVAEASLSIAIAPSPVTIGSASLPSVRATLPYTATLTAGGGTGVYQWSVVGALPAGLTLDAATGAVAGIATAAGTSSFSVRVTDAGDTTNVVDAPFSIIIGSSPVQFTASALPDGRISVAYAAAESATGGSGAFSWTVTAGSLPSGLSLNGSTGALTGMPSTAGAYAFTVAAADAGDATNAASAAYNVTVGAAPVVIGAVALPAGRERVAYAASAAATGGSGTVTWSALSPLPGGLALNTSTGSISGTPTLAGAYAVTLRATDTTDASNAATATYTVSIAAGIKVASPRTLPDATAGAAYAYTVLAASVVGTPTWNVQGGALPPGMSLNAITGVVSGICTTKGTYSFNARVKDSSTNNTLTLTITVR